MNRVRCALFCALFAAAGAGCSAEPVAGDVQDGLAADTAPDEGAADAPETMAPDDTVTPETTDATGTPETDAADEADIAEPDIPVVETSGAFRFDFVETATDQLDRFLTLTDSDRGTVAVSRCNTMATVFIDRYRDNGFNASLALALVNLETPPGIDDLVPRRVLLARASPDAPPAMTATVAWDQCVPIVFVQTDTGWDWAAIGEGEPVWAAVDQARTYSEILSMGAATGRDHKVHLFFRARPNGGTTQWMDAAFNGNGFDVRLFPNPDPAMISPLGAAANGDGNLVIGYRKAGIDSQEAWVASWNGTSWDREQVTGVTPSDLGASFAIGSYDREGLAWTAAVYSDDGLLLSASLKYTFRDTDDKFRTETVTVENDGYAGSGTRFTGSRPVLTIDGTGRPHILYSDLAVRTDGTDQTISNGQLRYAWRRISKWNHLTVFTQDPPGVDAQPYTGFRQVATSPDGTIAGIAGVAIVPDRFGTVSIDTLGWAISNAE